MQTAYELTINEVLTKDHNTIKQAFDKARTSPTREGRRDELKFPRQRIRLHETFEKHYYYPVALDCLGDNSSIVAAGLEEHKEIERLLIRRTLYNTSETLHGHLSGFMIC